MVCILVENYGIVFNIQEQIKFQKNLTIFIVFKNKHCGKKKLQKHSLEIMKIIIFIVALMIILGIIYKIHHYFLNKISYNNVIKESIFNNNNKGYLNVGLWKTETNNLYDAQKMMYLMFFSFAELHNPNQKVLETGCGSAEHYLLWKEYGLQSKMECYEISTNIHPEVKKMSENVTIYQKSALELNIKNEFNKIISFVLTTRLHHYL